MAIGSGKEFVDGRFDSWIRGRLLESTLLESGPIPTTSFGRDDMAYTRPDAGNKSFGLSALILVFTVGFLAGGAALYVIVKKPSLAENREVETPENQPRTTVQPPVKRVWIPNPGEECFLKVPEDVGLGGSGGGMYPIPVDLFSLQKLLKYARARDGKGIVGLLHQQRAVWSPKPEAMVLVIAVDTEAQTVEVRLRSPVYKSKYDIGQVSKEDSERMTGAEAVVLLSWLTKEK